jgi:hypothetical protein
MPFGAFKTLGEALRAFQVTETEEDFVILQPLPVSDYFRADLSMKLKVFDVECSEAAVCEYLISPVLTETVKAHAPVLGLWSHVPLYDGEELLGVPDYVIGKRSPLSKRLMDKPLAMIIEAKKNDFDAGWGQCLAALRAVQKINGTPNQILYGGVSDGYQWQFGKLQGDRFAHHPLPFELLKNLDELFAALNGMLELCKQQVLSPGHAA